MRIAFYVRVSTDQQDAGNQVAQLVSWAATRGWEVVATYQENETAWKAGHQKALAHLLDDAAKRKFDAVVVWALDRLSREGSLAILSLVHRLKLVGVRVISYLEGWTEAPGELGDLLFAIAGWGGADGEPAPLRENESWPPAGTSGWQAVGAPQRGNGQAQAQGMSPKNEIRQMGVTFTSAVSYGVVTTGHRRAVTLTAHHHGGGQHHGCRPRRHHRHHHPISFIRQMP